MIYHLSAQRPPRAIANDLDIYFKMFNRNDFIDVIPLKPLKPLKKSDLDTLFENPLDEKLWMSYFPPEDFMFKGIDIGYMYDVTRYYIANEINLKLVVDLPIVSKLI